MQAIRAQSAPCIVGHPRLFTFGIAQISKHATAQIIMPPAASSGMGSYTEQLREAPASREPSFATNSMPAGDLLAQSTQSASVVCRYGCG